MKRLITFCLIALAASGLAGCGSSTVTTKVTITERPDSLLIKGDSIAFTAKSDSLLVDSVRTANVEPPDTTSFGTPPFPPLRGGTEGEVVVRSPPRPAFYSVHAKKDTTIGRWKLRFAYAYPPDRWSVEILEADTMARWKVRDSLIEKPYEVEKIPWWITALVIMLGAALIISLVKR